jgi:DNA invertase Pin-like site-specific DNA recombinase
MNVIGYIRVSTEDQAREGVSLEMQRDRIHKWADLNEGQVVAVYEDAGISGTDMERPGLEAALSAATEGTAFVAYSISRIARSTIGMIEIAQRLKYQGADLVSISERIDTTSAAGMMMFRMLAVLAEFERDQISERTKAALAKLKANGKKLGSPHPERGGEAMRLAAIEREAPYLIAIRGCHTLAEATERLNGIGAKTAEGRAFTRASVSRMIRRVHGR